MEQNEANDFLNDFNVVLPGSRNTSSVAQIRALSSFNRLELSDAAAKLMNVSKDDRVIIVDRKSETEDPNKVYFIMSHPTVGAKLGELGTKKTFSYSGKYTGMIIGDPTKHQGGKADLKEAGMLIEGKTTVSVTHIATYKVVPTDQVITYMGEECKLFALTDRQEESIKGRAANVESDSGDAASE